MNGLISINFEKQTISARDLHEKLNIGTQYSKWFERMCEYGFIVGTDYEAISQKRLTAQGNETTFIDHNISIDMAKEICMIQRTPEGKKVRQYLIDLEKAWNTPELVIARGLQACKALLDEEKAKNQILLEDVERMKPKEIFADAVSTSENSILVRDLAKLVKQNGLDIGERRLYKWLRNHGYIVKNGTTPTQKAMNLGLFEVVENTVIRADRSPLTTLTTKVTGKGQVYLVNKLLAKEDE